MTVRTSMEARTRIEVTFSFDNEDEANAWIAQFKEASESYAEKVQGQANGEVQEQAGSKALEGKTKAKRSKGGVRSRNAKLSNTKKV